MRGIRTSVDYDPGRTISVRLPTETYLAFNAIAQAAGFKPAALLRELATRHVREAAREGGARWA